MNEIPRLYSSLAKYYNRLENQYRDYASESKWLVSLIESRKPVRLIDVSCGTGSHVLGIAKAIGNDRQNLVAMDSSSEMMQITKTALNDNKTQVDAIRGDFLNCPFEDSTFDMAFCMYWSLAGLDDNQVRRLFQNVHRILKKGGTFVFDVENAEGIKEHLLNKPYVDAFFYDDREACTVIRLNLSTKIEPDLVNWRAFYLLDWGTLSELITDSMTLRFYKRSKLESMLVETGFTTESVSSSASGKYEENSPSLYFVARSK